MGVCGMPKSHLLIAVLICLLLGSLNLASAANSKGDKELPEASWLESEISRLSDESPLPSKEVDQYRSLLERIRSISDLRNETQSLRETLADLPNQKKYWLNKIDSLKTEVDIDAQLSATELENHLEVTKARKTEWQTKLNELNQDLSRLSDEQNTLPESIAKAEVETRSTEDTALISAHEETETPIKAWLEITRSQEAELKLENLKLRQQSLLTRRELLQWEEQFVQKKIALEDEYINALHALMLQSRQASTQAFLQQAEKINQELSKSSPVLTKINQNNERYALELASLTIQLKQIRDEEARIETAHQRVSKNFNQVSNNIQWLKESPAFGTSLRAHLAALPKATLSTELAGKLADYHLRLYNLTKQRDELTLGTKLENLKQDNHLTQEENQRLQDLLNQQLELINKMLPEYEKVISAYTSLEVVRRSFANELKQVTEYLKQQQLWTRSHSVLWTNLSWTIEAWFGNPAPLIALDRFIQLISNNMGSMIAFSLLILPTIWLRRAIKRLEKKLHDQYAMSIGRVKQDKFMHTLSLILIAIIKRLPIPLLLLLAGEWIADHWDIGQAHELRMLVATMAAGYFVWTLFFSFSDSKGVFLTHLQWPDTFVHWLRKTLRSYQWIVFPTLLSMIVAELISLQLESEFLRLPFIALNIWFLVFVFGLMRKPRLPELLRRMDLTFLHVGFLRWILVIPIVLIIGFASAGYFFAAWKMLIYYLFTGMSFITAIILYSLAQRWLNIEQRKLAYQRALAKREELLARRQAEREEDNQEPNASSTEDIHELNMPVEEIGEQTAALMKVTLVIGLAASLLAIWSDALDILTWMNNIHLWEVAVEGKDGIVNTAVTLQSLLTAVTILAISIFAANNLPGVLELLVLRHLTLSAGSAYAFTTLLKYFILLVGILQSFPQLGFDWSKLQWLVAAFGVGLGFGLQEIFANFVSGLIILFERPIRIGDTITINDLSGTVTKINTRATTITDWDKKEIVVPNKAFITDKLINWSLSDPITRLVIPIGVAYGSDINKVENLLYRIANSNEHVMKEPAPWVLFKQFGASSLDFELRVFVPRTDLRLEAAHQINSCINDIFNKEGIEIAFPQLDVHIKDKTTKSDP